MELAPGSTIGRYAVVRLLGEGGMGAVYLAHDTQLDRRVALKLLHAGMSVDARARMAREARLMARFVSPNIVTVYDAGESDGQMYIVMELVEGQTLAAWLAAEPRSTDAILSAFRTAGAALAEAHAAGVAHRDFKPENVLLDRNGRVAVSDFGIASEGTEPTSTSSATPSVLPALPLAATHASGSLTRTGTLMGTPAYMSPEQFLGQPAGPASDQFSFGVALFEGLFNQPPFAAETLDQLRRAVLRGEIAPIPDAPRSMVPPGVLRALVRAMARDPAGRFPDMNALLAALETPRKRRNGRGLSIGIVIGLVILAAVGAAGVLMWRKRAADDAKREMAETRERLARVASRKTCRQLVQDNVVRDCVEVIAKGVVPHLFFALDNSASMAAHKAEEKQLVLGLGADFGIHVELGLAVFPAKNAAACEPGTILEAVQFMYTPQRDKVHRAELLLDLDIAPSGLPAPAPTLRELVGQLKKRKDRSSIGVVLVTNGGDDAACCKTKAGLCNDETETITALKSLAGEGVSTWVAGFSPSSQAKATLDRFAVAGGTKRSYDAVLGLADIESDVRRLHPLQPPTCSLDLPSALERPDAVTVLFDGELAPDGWRAESKKLILSGSACDRALTGELGHVRIVSE